MRILTISLILLLLLNQAISERIKDITQISGIRINQLIGYGLVVGLDGSGDNTIFTGQSFVTMLQQLGIVLPPGINPNIKNVAAVAVSAELPPFAKLGQTIDITVSSIGNAKSLRGGTLILTPLKGSDDRVYAVAQGNVVVGGINASGTDGSSVTVNIPSVGRIPNGATVEREVPTPFATGNHLIFNLRSPDFTTAKRVADAINLVIGKGVAKPMDAASIRVRAPRNTSQRVNYISVIENIEITPAEGVAKIIVNARTGTIVIGQHVIVRPAAVTHGSLTVTITETPIISQPQALSTGGTTVVVPTSNIQVAQENNRMFLFKSGTSLKDIVRAVNQVGATPADLIQILESLKQVGALQAELIII